jgi:hypothetical protein
MKSQNADSECLEQAVGFGCMKNNVANILPANFVFMLLNRDGQVRLHIIMMRTEIKWIRTQHSCGILL